MKVRGKSLEGVERHQAGQVEQVRLDLPRVRRLELPGEMDAEEHASGRYDDEIGHQQLPADAAKHRPR